MEIDMRLSREDLQGILEIVQDYICTCGHTVREGEYAVILNQMIENMMSDDHISVSGGCVYYVHG